MQHFRVPTLVVAWPDDSHDRPARVAITVDNCKPDPLTWLATFADACGIPPDTAGVYVPQARDLVEDVFGPATPP
jgi:hypothetical protein